MRRPLVGKQEIWSRIDIHSPELFELSDWIHDHPELGFQETEASARLSARLERAGFRIERQLDGMPTAFRATFGTTGPTIAFIAEMDALPDIGHACGHNIIGPAAIGAAISLSEANPPLPGRIMVIGTPAEEIPPPVKKRLVEAGFFKDVDLALITHGADRTAVGGETLGIHALDIEFGGRAAHAAAAPDKGISALDAAVLTMHAIELLREHVRQETRIHGIITNGGQAPNIVPERAALRYYLRSFDSDYLQEVRARVENCARGAALAVGADVEIKSLGVWDSRYNVPTLNDVLLKNAVDASAFQILPVSERTGSTDFGTVTRTLPAATLKVALVDEGVAGHSRDYERAAGGERGHRCLVLGAKAMAATAFDVLSNPQLLARIKREFAEGRAAQPAAGGTR
jgi:amidohydrolase